LFVPAMHYGEHWVPTYLAPAADDPGDDVCSNVPSLLWFEDGKFSPIMEHLFYREGVSQIVSSQGVYLVTHSEKQRQENRYPDELLYVPLPYHDRPEFVAKLPEGAEHIQPPSKNSAEETEQRKLRKQERTAEAKRIANLKRERTLDAFGDGGGGDGRWSADDAWDELEEGEVAHSVTKKTDPLKGGGAL